MSIKQYVTLMPWHSAVLGLDVSVNDAQSMLVGLITALVICYLSSPSSNIKSFLTINFSHVLATLRSHSLHSKTFTLLQPIPFTLTDFASAALCRECLDCGSKLQPHHIYGGKLVACHSCKDAAQSVAHAILCVGAH